MESGRDTGDLAAKRSRGDGEATGGNVGLDYTEEIMGLQRTLHQLGVHEGPQIQHDGSALGDEAESEELSDDFVPLHLVSVSPGRHTGFGSRRRSDPGRVPLYATRSPFGSSDSSEDDEMPPDRSPRARSPRRLYPEDECYPSINVLTVEGRLPQGFVSPRRRLYPPSSKQSQYNDEGPRRARTMRSHSLPLPDRAMLGGVPIGEAVGALASTGRSSPDTLSPHARQGIPKRGRCFSTTEEPILEAILEEAGAPKQLSLRRYSVPNPPHRFHQRSKLMP